MSRTRKKGSTYPFGGLGLEPDQEVKLKKLLKKEDTSIRRLCRYLVAQWITEKAPKHGL